MKTTLKALRSATANPAVSIFVKTHRTHPDNEKDPIALKNQLTEAHNRIEAECDKRTSDTIMQKVEEALHDIDHNYNLDTLAIFATTDGAKLLRLPFDAPERVIVGEHFATRDLMRNISQSVHYYVLAITSDTARLFEGLDDRLVKEIQGDAKRQALMSELAFPIHNTTLPTGAKADRTGSSDDNAYLKEFMNRIDKSIQEFHNIDPLPVIIVGDSRTLGFYEQVCDNAHIILGKTDHVSNLKDGKGDEIIAQVQDIVNDARTTRYEKALGEMASAQGKNLLRTDLQTIYRAAIEGNAVELLVSEGYSVPAKMDETSMTLTIADTSQINDEGVVDDAIGEIIELVSHHGGKVAFVPADKMADTPIALITRY